jgi:hypothetical protein
MSASGQKQTSEHGRIMSAIPPKADIDMCEWHVRFVPKADIHPPQSALPPKRTLIERVGMSAKLPNADIQAAVGYD